MRPRVPFSILLLASALACNKALPTSPAPATTEPGATIRLVSLVGTVAVAETPDAPEGALVLRVAGASDIRLTGATDLLRRVVGNEIVAYGNVAMSWVTNGGLTDLDAFAATQIFAVTDFEVRGHDGLPARDGIFEVADGGGYALRLRNGLLFPVADPPADLVSELGARVWIATARADGRPAAFGIIDTSEEAR